jgi:hypothetical protein
MTICMPGISVFIKKKSDDLMKMKICSGVSFPCLGVRDDFSEGQSNFPSR